MNWTEQSPWTVAAWVIAMITAYLAGTNTHRLALSRDSTGRRRAYREFVLVFLDRMETQPRGLRNRDYKATIPEIHSRSIIIAQEDIAFWKRKKFLRALKVLEGYSSEDIRPTPSAGETQNESDKRCKRADSVRDRICIDLRNIIRLAK